MIVAHRIAGDLKKASPAVGHPHHGQVGFLSVNCAGVDQVKIARLNYDLSQSKLNLLSVQLWYLNILC